MHWVVACHKRGNMKPGEHGQGLEDMGHGSRLTHRLCDDNEALLAAIPGKG